MNKQQEHIPFLDHIRAVAILLVFFFHALDPSFGSDHFLFKGWFRSFFTGPLPVFLAPFTFGFLGVAVFFVVSGFCIHLSHARSSDQSWSTFGLRRFFRIYPPYFVALLIFAFLLPHTRLDFIGKMPESFYQLFSHLFLVYNFDKATYWGINGAFWSIAVEVQLYLLYPLLLWITHKWGWMRALWITAIIEVGLRIVLGAFPHTNFRPYLNGIPFLYWYSWTIGAALAEAYLKKQPLPFARFPLFFWPAVTVVACLFEPLYPFCFLFAALSTVCAISYLLRRPLKAPAMTRPVGFFSRYIQFIGLISYSIYLVHQPMINSIPELLQTFFPHQVFPGLAIYGCCLVGWLVVTAVAYAFYRLIELPSIAWGKEVIRKKRAASTDFVQPVDPITPAVGGQ